jgi:hypothetical protein
MLTFVATSHKETTQVHIFIYSLLNQVDTKWKCIIFNDGPNDYIDRLVKSISDNRIEFHYSEEVVGNWGNLNRRNALEGLVSTEFVIQASIQDYYIPIAVSEINKFTKDYDFIYFDCLHHHLRYELLNSEPTPGRIDWGSFALRTELVKGTQIQDFSNPMTDGYFVTRCFEKYPKLRVKKIQKCLFVHN